MSTFYPARSVIYVCTKLKTISKFNCSMYPGEKNF